MRSLLLLTLLCFARVPFAFADEPLTGFAKWEKDVAAYEAADRENPPAKGGIVFIGSSSIRMWKTLAQDFPQHHVINRGFGGSEMADSAHFADRIVLPYEPRMIVVYSGGNDIHKGKTPEQVLAAFKDFVSKVRAKQPGTPIAYISIAGNPARWAQIDRVKAANAMIESYCQSEPNLKFIDTHSAMLGPDGLPKPDIFLPDRLHMNAEGYKLWTKIIGPLLPAPDR